MRPTAESESANAEQAFSQQPIAAENTLRGLRNETRRFLRFLVVGAGSFVVETTSLSLFVFVLGLDRTLAKGFAFVLAVISSFLGNYWFAYRDSRAKPLAQQAAAFAMVSVVGLGVNLTVFRLVDWACLDALGPVSALYVAHASAVGAALFWNYTVNRLVTYSDVKIGR